MDLNDNVEYTEPEILNHYAMLASDFAYCSGLLYAGESLLRRASIYLEDKALLDEIEAHLQRVDSYHRSMMLTYKKPFEK